MELVFVVWLLGVLPTLGELLIITGGVGIIGWAVCSLVMAAESIGKLHKA